MSIVAICKNVKTKLPANKETEIGVRGRDRACRVEAECDRKWLVRPGPSQTKSDQVRLKTKCSSAQSGRKMQRLKGSLPGVMDFWSSSDNWRVKLQLAGINITYHWYPSLPISSLTKTDPDTTHHNCYICTLCTASSILNANHSFNPTIMSSRHQSHTQSFTRT